VNQAYFRDPWLKVIQYIYFRDPWLKVSQSQF
jgi:hypothetical protein